MRFRSLPLASSPSLPLRRSLCHGAPAARSASRRFALSALLGTTLCAGALLATPLGTGPLWAAPTVGSDEGGPQVQILAPAYQDTLKGRFRISVGIKSTKFNPQSIELFVDDRSATKGPLPLAAFPSMSFDWNTRDYADGPHKLTVRVTDTQGFRGWAEVNVYINNGRKVDSLPPTLAWKNLTAYQTLSGLAQVELDAVDNFGVKWLMVTVAPAPGAGASTKTAPRQWLLNRPPYIAKFDTTAVPDGLYAFSAKAWDSTDQQGDARPLTVGVVNNPINATQIEGLLNGLRSDDPQANETAPKIANLARDEAPAPSPLPDPNTIPGYGLFDEPRPTPSASVSPGTRTARATLPAVGSAAGSAAPVEAKPKPARIAVRPQRVVRAAQIPARRVPRQGVRSGAAPLNDATTLAPALQPSSPLTVARALKAPAPARLTEPFVDERAAPRVVDPVAEIAAPEMSNPDGVADARSGPLEVTSQTSSASIRPRIARLDATETARLLEPTVVAEVDDISTDTLSRADAPELELAVSAPTASVRVDSIPPRSDASARSTEPVTMARLELEEAVPASLGTLSRNASPRSTLSAPARVETEVESPRAGRIATPTRGVAAPVKPRAETQVVAPKPRVEVQVAAPKPRVEVKVEPRVAKAEPRVEAPVEPERVVDLGGSAPIDLASPQLSAPSPAPAVRRSNGKLGELAIRMRAGARRVMERAASIKTPFRKRAIPVRVSPAPILQPSAPRISALPRDTREDGIVANVPSITVAPFEVSAPLRTPRIHRAWQSTTLRAVAARYGFPVELVAAANNWPTEMRVLKGMTVQLPRPLQVSLGGEPLTETPAFLAGDTSVAAFRFLFEQAGGTMQWDAANQRVIARKGDSEIVLSVGSRVARVDNHDVMMELAAFLFEGRTMIPIRFWEEGLKAQVEWDPQTGRIVVAMTG